MTNQPGLPGYDLPARFPPLVWRAVELTRAHSFPLACLPEVGSLLRTLAAKTEVERACELGTAFGVGAAWIASGLKTNASLVTVELDEHRATAATKLFAHTPAVTVFHGEWTLSLQQAPLDLLFSDGGPKREPGDAEKLLPLVRVGGLVVLDDFTAAGADNADASRRMWLENPTYDAHEVKVTKDDSVILAVRPR